MAEILKNTTGTTEKCLIVSLVSEWMCVLMYEQPCNADCCLVSSVARSVSTHLPSAYVFLVFCSNTHCALVVALPEKRKYHSAWLLEKLNSCTSASPNTHAWEQQE